MNRTKNKKVNLFLGLLLLLPQFLFAQVTYHVYSSEIPWIKTTTSIESGKIYSINEAIQSAESGDSIIIHQGLYRETVNITKDNVILQNYKDDYVLVTGTEIVKEWTNAENMYDGVKVADISNLPIETEYTQLFANGENQMMARHPNNTTGDMMDPMNLQSGYAPLSNVSKDQGVNANGHITLEDTTLPDVDLTGGIARALTGKMRQYVYGRITSNAGNTVSFTAINNGEWKDEAAFTSTKHKFSWGFVMHKNLIDSPGEWYAENDKLFYLPEQGKIMDSIRIEIQVRERVLVLNNSTEVAIKGINFIAGNIDMQNTNAASIENCSLRYLHPFWIPNGYGQNDTDPKGIYLSNSSENHFKDSYIAHSWGNMFALRGGQNNSFDNCMIKDFGWVGVFTSGIHINESNNTNINKCTFADAGRFQIRIDGGDAKVNILDCDFYGAMKMGEDAGPIEATSTGRIGTIDLKGSVIAYNKVHDVVGVPVSNGSYKRVKATAFYMEDVENYTAHHNLIYNIKHELYDGPHEIERVGEFLYLGPRYNAMHKPVNYYNNTIWNVDENIGVWNIRIDNWKELGITPPDTTGLIDNGHFANNIFMNGPGYKLNYSSQEITATGGKKSWADSPEGSSISTHDFYEFTSHCAKWGYQFNPENNQFYNIEDANVNFTNATTGNFNLNTGSSAIQGGVNIDGITSSETPDCGALEGGDRVLNAGANILSLDFIEEGVNYIPETEWVKLIGAQSEYPETTSKIAVNVEYNVFEKRDVLVALYTPTPARAFVQNTKITVEKGSGTVSLVLNLESSQPVANNYEIYAAIRPVGGNWQTTIVSHTVFTNIVVPVVESLNFKNLDTSIYSTDKTIALDVDYTVAEERKLRVSLLSPTNDIVTSKSYVLDKETNTIPVSLDVLETMQVDVIYTILLELLSEGETTESVLLNQTRGINVEEDPYLSSSKKKEFSLKVYPNPVHEILTIQLDQKQSGVKMIQIYSTNGILLHSQWIDANSTQDQINVSNLPNGTYLLCMPGYKSMVFIKN